MIHIALLILHFKLTLISRRGITVVVSLGPMNYCNFTILKIKLFWQLDAMPLPFLFSSFRKEKWKDKFGYVFREKKVVQRGIFEWTLILAIIFLNKHLRVGKVSGSESSVVLKPPIYNEQFELGDWSLNKYIKFYGLSIVFISFDLNSMKNVNLNLIQIYGLSCFHVF